MHGIVRRLRAKVLTTGLIILPAMTGCVDASDEEAQDAESDSSQKDDSSKEDSGESKEGDEEESEGEEDDDASDSEKPGDDEESPGSKDKDPKAKEDWDKRVARVFPDDRVVSIKIEFEDDGLEQMLEDWKQKREKTYQKTQVFWDETKLQGVGTRLKGYSTLMFAGGGPGGPGGGPGGPGLTPTSKLPLKINFDRFGGERFHSLDKVSLGTNAFDFSHMRERLSVNMFRKMGVPAAKTAFADVELNEEPVGIYTITQNINKRFLKQHFGTKNKADDGNLYKCVALERHGPGRPGGSNEMVCSLKWQGDKKSGYLRTQGCATGYSECGLVLKTNEDDNDKNDYSDLIHFLDVLNNTKDADFEDAIGEVFDVDSFLRFMAVSIGMVNLDSYFGRVNNFYLYHRPDTGKFMMLPWDLNMSYGHYGRIRGLSDLTEFPVQDPLKYQRDRDNHVLVDRLLAVPAFKKQYLAYVKEFIEEHFTKEVHQSMIAEYEALIRSPLEDDPNRRFTMEQFEAALGDEKEGASTGMGRSYNLLDFVSRRVAHIRKELQ